MPDRWLYATLEWVWTDQLIRLNQPQTAETIRSGSYQEIVELLTELGRDGWEVATSTAGGDWIFWTLKRRALD